MTTAERNTVTAEIATLRSNGISDILVSITRDGEAQWGDAMALECSEMEAAMEDLGYSSGGMMTAEEFETRYAEN